jgi:hypothetical protein
VCVYVCVVMCGWADLCKIDQSAKYEREAHSVLVEGVCMDNLVSSLLLFLFLGASDGVFAVGLLCWWDTR